MTPRKTKSHIFNVREISKRVDYNNSYQKLNLYMNQGVDFFKDKSEIEKTIAELQEGTKQQVAEMRKLLKQHK